MKTKTITLMGIMLSMTFILSIFESSLPPAPFLPPGVKFGFSNIITMYTLFFVGRKYSFIIALLKSSFVFITRGPIAGTLSISGGVLSLLSIILLSMLMKKRISYFSLSISGACFHNIGQVIALSIIMENNFVFYYIYILLISGLIMGSITGILLNAIMPAFNKVFGEKKDV